MPAGWGTFQPDSGVAITQLHDPPPTPLRVQVDSSGQIKWIWHSKICDSHPLLSSVSLWEANKLNGLDCWLAGKENFTIYLYGVTVHKHSCFCLFSLRPHWTEIINDFLNKCSHKYACQHVRDSVRYGNAKTVRDTQVHPAPRSVAGDHRHYKNDYLMILDFRRAFPAENRRGQMHYQSTT